MSSKVIHGLQDQPINFIKIPVYKTGIDFSVSIKQRKYDFEGCAKLSS